MATQGSFRLYCLIFLFFYHLSIVSVAGRMSKKLYSPMKEDIPFIKCDVCQKAVKYLFRKAKSMREDSTKVGQYSNFNFPFFGTSRRTREMFGKVFEIFELTGD